MTEKRFYVAESNLTDGYCVFDREKKYAFTPRPRKADCLNDAHTLNELHEENEQLKQELFESQVDYYAETYHDNPIRADDKINSLKREFKERFGKEFKYD